MKRLYNKYHITKANGTSCDPEAEYFVLRLDNNCKDEHHREASIKAILSYAESIKEHNFELYTDLINKYQKQ